MNTLQRSAIQFFLRTLIIALFAVGIGIFPKTAFAAIVFENEFLIEHNEAAAGWVIDSLDDASGDIKLQFGNALGEYITWDNTNNLFTFSDDIEVQGTIDVQDTNITLDSDNTGVGADITITANQGSDSDGILKYNATTDQWEISSDAGATYDDVDDNTLDEAYDEGGAGAGRTITADSGTVVINGDGLEVDNTKIDGNTISSTDTNGDVTIDPNGTGEVNLGADVDIDGNNVTFDADDTGGNITLQFGSALNETLIWDNTNTRFTFSDDARIEGNAAVIGQAYIAADHTAASSDAYINLGRQSSSWETLAFDTSVNAFEASDDWLPTVTETYDLGSASQKWKTIHVSEIISGDDAGDNINFGENGLSFTFFNGECNNWNEPAQITCNDGPTEISITAGQIVQVDTSGTEEVILTQSQNDSPIGVAATDSAYEDEIQVIVLGKANVDCTGSITAGDLIQSSNVEGTAKSGNNSTKILGNALSTCSGGNVLAIVHLE